jgi:hypothetical protein
MNRVFKALFGIFLFNFSAHANGQSATGKSGFLERSAARKQKSWYFLDHLGFKQQSADSDLLYRFYTAKNAKEGPRIESIFWGSFSSFQGNRSLGLGTGYGYAGRMFFNHFVSGTTGLPTLNIVPGVQASRSVRSFTKEKEEILTWGPSLRFFGLSHQDSQVRISLLQNINKGKTFASKAWRFEVAGEFFLSPWLAFSGHGYLPRAKYGPKPSSSDHYEKWAAGGFLELGPLRLGYEYVDERFALQPEDTKQPQISQNAFVGISF